MSKRSRAKGRKSDPAPAAVADLGPATQPPLAASAARPAALPTDQEQATPQTAETAQPADPEIGPPRPPRSPRSKKPQTQVAALCLNEARDRILLITSRGTGRWIIPKGWPMRKHSLPGTALQEAWEEAGVEGTVGQRELGRYHYDKLHDHGFAIPVEVRVFPVVVTRLKNRFPEAGEREREWFRLEDAAPLVAEDSLRGLILSLPSLIAAGDVPKKGRKRRK